MIICVYLTMVHLIHTVDIKDITHDHRECIDHPAHLIAVDHEVLCGDEGLEDHHPASVGGPLKQRVRQLRNVHVHLVGAVDQI